MKTTLFGLLIILFSFSNFQAFAQEAETITDLTQQEKEVVVTKNDGTEYIGVILEQNDREVLLLTKSIGKIYIPKHEIASIDKITKEDFRDGVYMGNNLFSTRYFITTNGLPMKKGDSYALIQLFGPDIQYAINEHITIGGITTWIGLPVIGTAKFSFSAHEKVHFALGGLAGSGTWLSLGSFGAIGYGSLTFGDYMKNISVTAGYAGFSINGNKSSSMLYSFAGMAKLNDRIAIVFDSFIYP